MKSISEEEEEEADNDKEGGAAAAAAVAGEGGNAQGSGNKLEAGESTTPPGSPAAAAAADTHADVDAGAAGAGSTAAAAAGVFDMNAAIARGVSYVDAALSGCNVQFTILPGDNMIDKLQIECTPTDASASVEIVGFVKDGVLKRRAGIKRGFFLRHVEVLNNIKVVAPAMTATSPAASMTATFCYPPLLEKEDSATRVGDAVNCILTRLRLRQFRCAALLCRAFRHFVPMTWPQIKDAAENPTDAQVLQYLAHAERHHLATTAAVPMYRWPTEKDDNVAGQPCLKVIGDILLDAHRIFYAEHSQNKKADLRTILPGLRGKYKKYPPWILAGAVIVLADDVGSNRSVHSKKAKEVGGNVVKGLATDVTHVVARSAEANVLAAGGGLPVPLCAWQEVGWHKLGVKVVKLDWLKSCVKNQTWADESPFLLRPAADPAVIKATKAAVKQAEDAGDADAALRLVAGTVNEQKRAAIIDKVRRTAAKLDAMQGGQEDDADHDGSEREAVAAEHKQNLEDKELIEELVNDERELSAAGASSAGAGDGDGDGKEDGGASSFAVDAGEMDSEFMDLMNGDDSDSDDDDGSGSDDDAGGGGGGGGSTELEVTFGRPAKRKRYGDDEDIDISYRYRKGLMPPGAAFNGSTVDAHGTAGCANDTGSELATAGYSSRGRRDFEDSSSSSDDDDAGDGDDDGFALDLEAALQGNNGEDDEDEDPYA